MLFSFMVGEVRVKGRVRVTMSIGTLDIFVAGTRPISHRVGRSVGRSVCLSVGPSVGLSHFAFFAFLGVLRLGEFVFEHAPAQIITAPAQIIIAPAQIVTAPAQPPATGAVVYTALFIHSETLRNWLRAK